MFSTSYLIRLDDACPMLNKERWDRIEAILDKYHIKPMVGIVPDCKDGNITIDEPDPAFWEKALFWQSKGWAIALHGYDHCYLSEKGMEGLNPLWKRSEFAGLPLDVQREKIKNGVSILKSHGLYPKYFFAPSHTYDKNTLEALRNESEIRIISDTVATKPYRMNDFIVIPQVGGHCTKIWLPGVWTFCLHPNVMEDESFVQTENFLRKYQNSFVSFDDLNLEKTGKKDWFSRLLSWGYFTYRRLRGIK